MPSPADETAGPTHLRQRPQGTSSSALPGLPGLPGFVALSRDSVELPSTTSESSGQPLAASARGALEVETPVPEVDGRRGLWHRLCGWLPCYWRPATRDHVQTANARGWLGHCIRWMPLIGVIIGSLGFYFAVRNFRLIFAQRTLSLLRQTSPALNQAHNDILDGLAKIQRQLGIENTSRPEPPLPPELTIDQPGR